MRMVNRTVEMTAGDILIGGESVRDKDPAQLRREIGYVIQQIGLFPHRTIAENIAAVPQLLGWKKDRTRARTTELLELIGLDPELGERYPAQLSGGQQQRVGVARALAADPLVMLMDEPFGAIDPISRERLQNEFLRLQAQVRKTVLFVTHDIDEAIKMGDRIAIMKEGGRVEQYATPAEMLMAPATEFVEDFVGADRALKRLALMRVADIDLWEAPLAYVGQPTAEVRAKLAEPDVEVPYPLLVDSERRPLGWLSERDLARRDRPRQAGLAARPAARPRRHHARRPRRPAPGRGPVRGRGRPRRPDRRRALGRDHLRVPQIARRRRRRSTAPWSAPWLARRCLAAVGEVGKGFIQERTSDTLPCQATDSSLFCWDWAKENIDRYDTPTLQHLELVLISVVLGFAVAFALALLAHRRRWLQPPLLAATGVLYTIPSIAFFFLLLPITGRGRDTAIIALSAYTLQIIYRNTIVGLANVPGRGQRRGPRHGHDRAPDPLEGRAAAGGAGDLRRAADRDGQHGRDRDPGGLRRRRRPRRTDLRQGINFPTNIIIAGGIAFLMAIVFDLILFGIQRLLTPWRRAARHDRALLPRSGSPRSAARSNSSSPRRPRT